MTNPRHIDTHTIRLRGPWEYQRGLAADDAAPSWSAWARIKMPCRWEQLKHNAANQIASAGQAASATSPALEFLAPSPQPLVPHPAPPDPRRSLSAYRFRRAFGCPTCLDPHEQVYLVLENCWPAVIALNGAPLDRINSIEPLVEFEITKLLRERNELIIELDSSSMSPSPAAGTNGTIGENLVDLCPIGEVRLEIRG